VVIFSLVVSLGMTFYFDQKATMISVEVVPFLLLAIGVDNIFLIARAERTVPEWVTDVDERIGFAMKEIGPSIFTAALCESIAFFVGLLTDVPALQNFCLIAGIGVVADFFLQITIFVPALAIDRKRMQHKRGDLICCCKKYDEVPERREEFVRPLFQKHYVPMLFTKRVMAAVFGVAICLVTVGVFSCYKLLLGLNQNVSLVEGSDTFDYFETLYDYGDAGAPAYLVFKNVDYTV
jgi:Niemann-Pick C1 protein